MTSLLQGLTLEETYSNIVSNIVNKIYEIFKHYINNRYFQKTYKFYLERFALIPSPYSNLVLTYTYFIYLLHQYLSNKAVLFIEMLHKLYVVEIY